GLIHFKYPLLPGAITEQGHAVGWLYGKYPTGGPSAVLDRAIRQFNKNETSFQNILPPTRYVSWNGCQTA
ncbi:hypothetical protein NL511_30150, partial [Klebsiella pneumoniae]|nr:hypothetical protein [Klebsiella pneumoniae]